MPAVAESTRDVVGLGAGCTGLAAAAEAAKLGRKVVVLEKNATPGGSTSWSVGTITATNTRLQKRAGIEDSRDWHFEDLAKHAGTLALRDNTQLRRILVDQCTDALDWLMSLGVVFVGPMPERPHRVSRMHNVVPNSKAFVYHLVRHCRKLGVQLRVSARATAPVIEQGRVVAVECSMPSGKERFRATRAVVLASGDYSASRSLKAHYARPEVVDVEAVNESATGGGHKLALALGAKVINGDIVRGPIMRFVPPKKDNARERASRPAIGAGPYCALGPLKSYCVFADGGLAVSERLEVLRADGTPIPAAVRRRIR